MTGSAALELIIAAAAVTSLAMARPARLAAARPGGGIGGRAGVLRSPGAALAVVVALIYLNQVLFTVYVLRARHGDVAFIGRYLPAGWFDIVRGGPLAALARHFPGAAVLAPTVLRVQAFLELPFTVFAYLTVCRWFGVYQRARRLVWPACAVSTATFALVEWELRNPYTVDDLIIRAVSALVVPLWAARLADDEPQGGHNALSLGLFALRTVAIGWLALVVYGTALLYDLGRVGAQWPGAAAALATLAAVAGAGRLPAVRRALHRDAGRGVDSIARTFGWFLVLFFVPALPVRYGLSASAPRAAAVAALALLGTAAFYGVREALAREPGRPAAWAAQMAVSGAAGAAGVLLARWAPGGYTESRLLWAVAAFFVGAVAVCAAIDRIGLCAPARAPG